jgi:hypothetical protein
MPRPLSGKNKRVKPNITLDPLVIKAAVKKSYSENRSFSETVEMLLRSYILTKRAQTEVAQ